MLKSIKARAAAVAFAATLSTGVLAADITGAGATFIYPLLSKWSADYNAATPSLPLPPTPTGHLTEVPSPTLVFHSGLTLDR